MWVWLGNFWYDGFTAYIHDLFELRGPEVRTAEKMRAKSRRQVCR